MVDVIFTPVGMIFWGAVFIILFVFARGIIGMRDDDRQGDVYRSLRYAYGDRREALEERLNRIGKYAWLRSIPLFMIAVIVLQLVAGFTTFISNNKINGATPAQAAEYHFGMEHGETFPLVIGDRIDGSTVRGSARGGLFSHSFEMQSSLDTAFAVDYVYNGSHYPLVIPSSKTEYITEGVEPGVESITMELEINNHSGAGNTSNRLGALYSSCEMALWNLLWTCQPDGKEPRYEGGPNTLAEALSGDGIWHVTVRLTEENYSQLFGFSS